MFLEAPLRPRAAIGGFCSGRTLQALLCASRTAAERFSEPAVLRQVAFTCFNCNQPFTAADNPPDACRYHPCTVTSMADSQGAESRERACCRLRYHGSRQHGWDEARAQAVEAAPGCVVDAHYPRDGPQTKPRPGDAIEVLPSVGRGEGGSGGGRGRGWERGELLEWKVWGKGWDFMETLEDGGYPAPPWDVSGEHDAAACEAFLETQDDNFEGVRSSAAVRRSAPGAPEQEWVSPWQVRWAAAVPSAAGLAGAAS